MDEMQQFADFLGEMIAKHINEIDLDSLPDPYRYIALAETEENYRNFIRLRNRMRLETSKKT